MAWQIDLRNCVAKKVNLGDPENNEHPYNFTLCDTIEEYLLLTFRATGFDIQIDSSQMKKRRIVKFSLPFNSVKQIIK